MTSFACPRCLTQNPPQAKFCSHCGLHLQAPQVNAPSKEGAANSSWNWPLVGSLSFVGLCIIALMVGTISRHGHQSIGSPSSSSLAQSTPIPTPTVQLTASEQLASAKKILKGEYRKEAQEQAIRLLNAIPKNAKEHREAQLLLKRSAEQYLREEMAGPKPVTTPWNGTVLCVDRLLRETLNDYESAEYLQWSELTKVKSNGITYWQVSLKLRAKNAFGAKIINVKTFLIQHDQVVKVID